MTSKQSKKSISAEKMQRFSHYTAHLPNIETVKENAYSDFKEIKQNLTKAILLNEIRPGFMHWTTRLETYINEYGLCFKKRDHVCLIQLYLEVLNTEDIDFILINVCLNILVDLLKKIHLLSHDDLKIDWKVIYKLFVRIRKVDERTTELIPANIDQVTVVNFICYARIYFDLTATKEMLEEWRPFMCPFDMKMAYSFELCDLFLPTLLKETDNSHGFHLWLKEFLNLWLTISSNRSYWESSFISLLSRVASDNIGLFDWTPYIPFIFSKLLRGFGLSLAADETQYIDIGMPKEASAILNSLSLNSSFTTTDIYHISKLIVSMISTGTDKKMCMDHILKTFKLLRSYYYPSNTGVWMENFFALLESFPNELIDRIRHEKSEKYSQIKSKETVLKNSISDSDIETFVECLKDIVLTAIFSKTHFNDAIKTYQYLCFLRADLMLPPLLERISSSFHGLIETHRYTPMLACLVSVPRELVTYRSDEIDIIALLRAVLPGIDINDLNKFILTNQLLTNVFGSISICDCSPALDVRDDLSEAEKQLCMQTASFEDFIHELLKKIFDYIDNSAKDSSDDTDSGNTGLLSNSNDMTEENVLQGHLIQMLKVLVTQSSTKILKMILKKLKSFMNEKSFDSRSGAIVGSFCGFLTTSLISEHAFETLFNMAYKSLKQFKESQQYETFLKNVRGERSVKWNLQLLSHLTKANGILLLNYTDKTINLLNYFKSSINMDCIQHTTNCYNQIIASLSNIYPTESSSFNEFTLSDESNDFFKNCLPIRYWGKYVSYKELKINYHIPTSKEIKTVIHFVNSTMNESMNFLNKSILRGSIKSTKEENYRELNFIYHVLYGSSRILKRGSHKILSDHIQSNVKIGVTDNLDKGLGFEKCDQSNNDYDLTSEEIDIVLNLRDKLTKFIIKLTEKLLKDSSSDTVLFILISRILATSSMTYGLFSDDFKKSWESHFITKATIQNKLIIKEYPREELIRRITLQYNYRSFHIHTQLNELDLETLNILTNLAIYSAYQIVREEARSNIYFVIAQYPYSALKLVPKLTDILERNNSEKKTEKRLSKEQMEGCLLLLNGNSEQASFLLKKNWSVMANIWPALFRCKNFEKEDMNQLLDAIYNKTNENYESYNNTVKFNPKSLITSYILNPTLAAQFTDSSHLQKFEKFAANEKLIVSGIMQSLIAISSDSKTVLKNQRISLFSLIYLFNSCQRSPDLLTTECVKLFVDMLVHENINFRMISLDGLCIILKMIKNKKRTNKRKIRDVIREETNSSVDSQNQIVINEYKPGYRQDNSWHLYDRKFLNDCFETTGAKADEDVKRWESTNFLDKSYWGYYCWPNQININSNEREFFQKNQESASPFKHVIKPIIRKFQNDADFVKLFIKYSSLEESKSFDKKKFHLFKALFRNFGNTEIVNGLFEHLKRLVTNRDPQMIESDQKVASEIVSGLIRGSKYWPLNSLKKLWKELVTIFDLIFKNLTSETLTIWLQSFSNSFEDQDPRRMTFYLNYFQDLFLKVLIDLKMNSIENKKSSFEPTNILQLLTAFAQFEWRIPSFWNGLLTAFEENMSNTNKSVREILPGCLSLATSCNIDHSIKLKNLDYLSWKPTGTNAELTGKSSLKKFIDNVGLKLQESIELFEIIGDKNSEERMKEIQRQRINEFISNLNYVQTLVNWLFSFASRSIQPFNKQILKIIEKTCSVDKVASYDDTVKIKLLAIRAFLPIMSLDEECIDTVTDILIRTSKSENWRTRLSTIQIVQNYSIFNLFLLDPEAKAHMKNIIIESICDSELKVRQSACVALTGMIHSNFVNASDELITHFKTLAKTKIKTKSEPSPKTTASNLIKRHAGLLGLCSVTNASPYDVPDHLPEVITYICQFVNDPEPIQDTAKKCLSEFKRTHHDNWQENKLKFSEEQLSILSETTVSHNYYA